MRRTSERVKFGHTVRRLRLSKGWTQEELASRARLHTTYLGGIERGERNLGIDNIFKLARALGVSPSALFTKSANN
jgi:transcriptional regulator with XRE-family HTH domain